MKNILYALILLVSCQSYEVIQKPIVFDQQRSDLSLEYLKSHYDMEVDTPLIDPKMIVIHWTDISSAEKTFDAFYPALLPASRDKISGAGRLNVSAHFLVDRDGTIYQLLPENVFARHVIGLNYCAIGIENVANGDDLPLTRKQLRANVYLVNRLAKRYNITFLIGHDQYKSFIGHQLWKEKDPNYLTDKDDVGPKFIKRVHQKISNPLLGQKDLNIN